MEMTLISDKEAARLLGVHHMTIRNAVKRGDLTRVPIAGQVQRVAKEQVELFQNNKILKGNLDREDRENWEAIEADILGKQPVPASEEDQRIMQEFKKEMARQNFARIREEKRIAAEKEERFLKEYPFLQKELEAKKLEPMLA